MDVSEYAKCNPRCELCGTKAEHTHHIWGGTRRINHKSNLIRLCVGCHHQMHEVPGSGRISCMIAKLRKGEFDTAELDECAGLSVVGWIENRGTSAVRLLAAMRARDARRNNHSGSGSGNPAGVPEAGGTVQEGDNSEGNSK